MVVMCFCRLFGVLVLLVVGVVDLVCMVWFRSWLGVVLVWFSKGRGGWYFGECWGGGY